MRVCPSCFGAVAVGMRHCPHCGAEVLDSKSEQKASLKCPRCECNLDVQIVGKYPLHVCKQCGGLWVKKESFQNICTREEEQEAVLSFRFDSMEPLPGQVRKSRRAYAPCPECQKLMNHRNFSGSGIVLDWCRDHGSWFDKAELQHIIMFIREGGLRKAREREISQLREREKELRKRELRVSASLVTASLSPDVTDVDFENSNDPILYFLNQLFR